MEIGVEEGVEWVWRRGGDRCGGGGGVGVEEGVGQVWRRGRGQVWRRGWG